METLESMLNRYAGDTPMDFAMTAASAGAHPRSLQVLFSGRLSLRSQALTAALQAFHPSLSDAVFLVDDDLSGQGASIGTASWARHVVRLLGFNNPMDRGVVERCVQPARYSSELRDSIKRHRSYAQLFYGGMESTPLEQYVALAAVAGTLAAAGALVVLNERASTSFPATSLASANIEGDSLEVLRALPPPALYCGIRKLEIKGETWLRTAEGDALGVPDLAMAVSPQYGPTQMFEIFSNVIRYVMDSGASLAPGHTVQVYPDLCLKLRAPAPAETFLESDLPLYVLELPG